jgi:hypothetical protein
MGPSRSLFPSAVSQEAALVRAIRLIGDMTMQHDAHIDSFWEAQRGFVAMQLHGGLDPFTGRGEFDRPIVGDFDDDEYMKEDDSET